MDWSKTALLFFFPLFLLGVLADKFDPHIGSTSYTRGFVLIMLALGTLCVIASWLSNAPQRMRFFATLFFVVLDAYVVLPYVVAQFAH
jgi:hypothetical protein